MVRLKELSKKESETTELRFNSKMVRLKEKIKFRADKDVFRFNSKMVRLKVSGLFLRLCL